MLYWYDRVKGFIGFWKNNKQNGYGKFLSENKKIRYGKWNNGTKNFSFDSYEAFEQEIKDKDEGKYLEFFKMDYTELGNFTNNFKNMS